MFARSKSTPNYKRDNKFILVFTTKHTAGALSRAISVIGEAGFNMVSIIVSVFRLGLKEFDDKGDKENEK